MFSAIQTVPWLYPMLEVAHIAGISLLLGNLVLLELRVFGAGAALAVKDLARLTLGLAVAGFSLAGATGLLMFAAQANELLANRAFLLKMLLIMLLGCNAALFHGRGSLQKLDTTARALMAFSTLKWLAVLTCGRWIAYV